VLDDFAEDAAVAAADDEDAPRVGVGVHGKVGDHLLVAVASHEHSFMDSRVGLAVELRETHANSSRSVH